MRAECVHEVVQAIGRTPSKTELAEFESALLAQMRELARTEPKWRELTGPQRIQVAAEMAQRAAVEAAEKAAQRRALNLAAQAREATRLQARAEAKGGETAHHDALFERMRQVDDYVAGVRNEALAGLVDTVEAIEPRFFGLFDDPAQHLAFARAVLGEGKPEPQMAKAAKAYVDAIEALRVRANEAGADIGKLDYAYLPQPHDTGRVARAGAERWAQDVLPKLDRSRYVDASGNTLGDAEVLDLLRNAWTTIATEGRNQRVPGQARGGSRASRFDEKHRAIHFRDAQSYIDYLGDYGRGSMLAAIHDHIGTLAKTIGMLEELGANPTSTYRLLKDLSEQRDNRQGVHESFATLDMVWDTLNGTTAQPVNAKLARFFQGVRNFTTAAKLQRVMLSSITDAPLQVIVAKANGVPLGGAMGSLFAGVGKGKRELAHELGIGMDEIAGEMARWHQDHLAQGWTAKLAQTTMRATLVESWTNALRRGFALTLSGTLNRMRTTDWDALTEFDRARFEASGVTASDWRVWQQAADDGTGLLTRQGIRAIADLPDAVKDRAVARLLGYLDQEARTAVLAPDVQTRAMVQQGTKAGTVGGELLRSIMLFKSFAFGIVDKHVRRIRTIPSTSGKVAYSAAMMSSLTLFGAVALQLKDIASGKDPRDMTTGKFWAAAFLQGGGLGIFGDVLYTGMGGDARGGQANWTSLAGPVFGNAFDLADLSLGNAYRAATDKKTQFGADAIRFARSNTPFVNLWYLGGAVDHLLLHDLQEQASPGYLRRMRQRARKDWGQGYWWEPGQAAPERAPDLEAAAGKR